MRKIPQLLIDYHTKVIPRAELLQELVTGDIILIAAHDGFNSLTINIQNFIREGKSFVPLFSDIPTANRLLAGAKLNPGVHLCEARVDYLAENLSGPELLVIDAGDEFMLKLYAYELKSVLAGSQSSTVSKTKVDVLEGHHKVLTFPTSAKIGTPFDPPSSDALREMQAQLIPTAANTVYWFWMSILGGIGHLGLAVSPGDAATLNQVGGAIETVWKKHRPDNSLISVVSLEIPGFSEIVRVHGKLLCQK